MRGDEVLSKTTAPGYMFSWPTKFEDIDGDALMMLNRLCAFCRRMKEKHAKDGLTFVLGASEYSTEAHKSWTHKMVYPTAKKKRGRKECVAYMLVNKVRDGKRINFILEEPAPKTEPHIHIMLEGGRASTHAQTIVSYLNRQSGSRGKKARKIPLQSSHDVSDNRGYIEGQSSHLRNI